MQISIDYIGINSNLLDQAISEILHLKPVWWSKGGFTVFLSQF